MTRRPSELRVSETREGGAAAAYLRGLAYRSGMAGQTMIVDAYGAFRERIRHGAARSLLGTTDTRFLTGHRDDGVPLARSTSRTLSLWEDNEGLQLEAVVDADAPQVKDLLSAVARGDLTGLSIRFSVAKDGEIWNNAMTDREIVTFQSLPEISAVWSPAYRTSRLAVVSASEAAAQRTAREVAYREFLRTDLAAVKRRQLEINARPVARRAPA